MKFKKKFISATLSLVVATVLMASSSYAWFTISTNPEVSNIKTSITANENIEIALDNGYANAEAVDAAGAVINGLGQSGNPYTWGNLLDLSVAMTNIGGMLSLKPVGYSYDSATDKVTMKTPEYGLDGRVARLNNMAQQYISAYNAITSPSGGVSVFKPSADATSADALALSFWLRSNEDVGLQLSEGTYRADDGANADGTVNAEQGLGSVLKVNLGDYYAQAKQVRDTIPDMSGIYTKVYTLSERQVRSGRNAGPSYYHMTFEEWKSMYDGIKKHISDNLKNDFITIKVSVCVTPLGETPYKVDIDTLYQELKAVEDDFEFETLNRDYFNAVTGSVAEIVPTEKLMRYLSKLKIRFRTSEGGEMKDYYARIGSFHTYPLDDERRFWYGDLPERYRITYRNIPLEGTHGVCFCERDPKAFCIDEDTSSFCFALHFYDESDPLFAAYEEAMFYDAELKEAKKDYYGELVYNLYYADIETDSESEAEIYNLFAQKSREELERTGKALPHIALSANEAKKVDVYMYLDGEAITNADAATMDGFSLSLNLQFEKLGGATNAMTAAAGGESADDDYLEGGNAYGLLLADDSLHLVYGMETYTVGQPFAGSTITEIDSFDPGRAYPGSPFQSAMPSATAVVVESSFRRARPVYMNCWFCGFTGVSSITGLENINTSQVVNMASLFKAVGSFSSEDFVLSGLSSWDTSSVTDMSYMFYETGASAYSYDIGDLSSWDVSNVEAMVYMFSGAGQGSSYSLDLSSWNPEACGEHSSFNSQVESKIIPPVWPE